MARLSANDKKIIDAHPDASAHDLLTLHGLSEAGFNFVSAQRKGAKAKEGNAEHKYANVPAPEQPAEQPKKPLTPTVKHILQPQLDAPMPTLHRARNKKVRLIKIGAAGSGTLVDRNRAEKMVRMYPKQYAISRK